MGMVFVETPIFTDDVLKLLDDEEYAQLQVHLADHPGAGPIMEGTGGLRKVRWTSRRTSRGKRGGVRVIYYYVTEAAQIRMLLIYRKGIQDKLTPQAEGCSSRD